MTDTTSEILFVIRMALLLGYLGLIIAELTLTWQK